MLTSANWVFKYVNLPLNITHIFSISIVFSASDQSISVDVIHSSDSLRLYDLQPGTRQLPALMSGRKMAAVWVWWSAVTVAWRYLQTKLITITFASAPSHRRILLVFPSLLLSRLSSSSFPSPAVLCFFFFCSLYICFSTRTHTEPCAVDCRVLPTRPLSLAPEHAAVPPDSSPRLFLWVFFLFVFWPLSQYLFGRTPLEGFRITRPFVNVLTNRTIMSV